MDKKALILVIVLAGAIIGAVIYSDLFTVKEHLVPTQPLILSRNITLLVPNGTILAKGSRINSEHVNLTAFVEIVNLSYKIYVIMTNEGEKPIGFTFNSDFFAQISSNILKPCLSRPIFVSIAKGYYTLSNLSEATYVTYDTGPIPCPLGLPSPPKVTLYPYESWVFYEVIPGQGTFLYKAYQR